MNKELTLDDYNFQSIKKFVACKGCQYYENEKCMNKDNCFWLETERKLIALELIKNKQVDCQLFINLFICQAYTYEDYFRYIIHTEYNKLTEEEFDLLKEVLSK